METSHAARRGKKKKGAKKKLKNKQSKSHALKDDRACQNFLEAQASALAHVVASVRCQVVTSEAYFACFLTDSVATVFTPLSEHSVLLSIPSPESFRIWGKNKVEKRLLHCDLPVMVSVRGEGCNVMAHKLYSSALMETTDITRVYNGCAKKLHDIDQGQDDCLVCFEPLADSVLVAPWTCDHTGVCRSCMQKLAGLYSHCPQCRAKPRMTQDKWKAKFTKDNNPSSVSVASVCNLDVCFVPLRFVAKALAETDMPYVKAFEVVQSYNQIKLHIMRDARSRPAEEFEKHLLQHLHDRQSLQGSPAERLALYSGANGILDNEVNERVNDSLKSIGISELLLMLGVEFDWQTAVPDSSPPLATTQELQRFLADVYTEVSFATEMVDKIIRVTGSADTTDAAITRIFEEILDKFEKKLCF